MINDFLKDYVGFTAKESVLLSIQKALVQERSKALGYENKNLPMASVRVEDPKSKEILGLGASVPNDLINDNFGEIFAAIHGALTSDRTFSGLKDTTGAGPFTIRVWRPVSGQLWDNRERSSVRVGQGTTPPTRSDFVIETAFSNGGPEDSRVSTGNGGYNSSLGTMTVTTNISPTGGAGTVNEVIVQWEIDQDSGVQHQIVMTRDSISPGVDFVGGQAIVPVYTWQI